VLFFRGTYFFLLGGGFGVFRMVGCCVCSPFCLPPFLGRGGGGFGGGPRLAARSFVGFSSFCVAVFGPFFPPVQSERIVAGGGLVDLPPPFALTLPLVWRGLARGWCGAVGPGCERDCYLYGVFCCFLLLPPHLCRRVPVSSPDLSFTFLLFSPCPRLPHAIVTFFFSGCRHVFSTPILLFYFERLFSPL